MNKKILAVALGAMCVLCTNIALAEGTEGGFTETQSGKDQNVIFKDDVLAAGQFGPHDARILVMPTPKRVMLLRPRTQFVTEMLKSVEAL